jgi:hypothetical protein
VFTNYTADPMHYAGLQGIYGIIINLILLVLFQNYDCDPNNKYTALACTVDDKGQWKLENTKFAFKQILAILTSSYLF